VLSSGARPYSPHQLACHLADAVHAGESHGAVGLLAHQADGAPLDLVVPIEPQSAENSIAGHGARIVVRNERTSPLLRFIPASRSSPHILVQEWLVEIHWSCRREFAVEAAGAEFDHPATRVGIAVGFLEFATATE